MNKTVTCLVVVHFFSTTLCKFCFLGKLIDLYQRHYENLLKQMEFCHIFYALAENDDLIKCFCKRKFMADLFFTLPKSYWSLIF